MMVESSTEQKWLERRRYHNGLAWDFLRPHRIGEKAGHSLCNEDDATVKECERSVPSSNYHCSTYRKEIVRQGHVAEIRDQGSLKVGDS